MPNLHDKGLAIGTVRPRKASIFQKPCIADSRSLGNNQLKAKLLRPFGQGSDLLRAIPGFIVFGFFVNVRLSCLMSL